MLQLDLWIADTNQPIDLTLLTAEERAEVERYRFEADRKRSAMSRCMRRIVLARQLNQDPRELRFTKSEEGKPALVDTQSWPSGQAGLPVLHFNVSHAGERVVMAVADAPLGVDVEGPRRLRDARAIASRFFAPAEQTVVSNAADIEAAFFAIWTAKEAVVKAIGLGLSQALDSFVVHPELDRYTPVESHDPSLRGLNVRSFALDGGYRGALAIRGEPVVSIKWLC